MRRFSLVASACALACTSGNSPQVAHLLRLRGDARERRRRSERRLIPFYSTGEAYVEYRTAGSLPATGLRGTVTTFDARGRVWCSSYQAIVGSLPDPTAVTTCQPSSTDDAAFRLATEARYAAPTMSGRGPYGGKFLSVRTIPPDLNSAQPSSGFSRR